jgi:hypothetical protein
MSRVLLSLEVPCVAVSNSIASLYSDPSETLLLYSSKNRDTAVFDQNCGVLSVSEFLFWNFLV